jgi:hypothetical protein
MLFTSNSTSAIGRRYRATKKTEEKEEKKERLLLTGFSPVVIVLFTRMSKQ